MNDIDIKPLFDEMEKLQHRFELSTTVDEDYFEPGMMEFLDKSWGNYDEETREMILRFEAKGTRYEGRTPRIETVNIGDKVIIVRDKENKFN